MTLVINWLFILCGICILLFVYNAYMFIKIKMGILKRLTLYGLYYMHCASLLLQLCFMTFCTKLRFYW